MMKHITLLVCSIAFVVTASNAQTPVFESAVEYNDYIVEEQIMVFDYITLLMDNIDSEDELVIRAHYDLLLGQAKSSLVNILAMEGWNGNTNFRDASIELFTFYVNVITNEYAEIINIMLKTDYTVEDENRLDELLKQITDKESVLDRSFAAAQEQFALENDMELIDEEEYDDY